MRSKRKSFETEVPHDSSAQYRPRNTESKNNNGGKISQRRCKSNYRVAPCCYKNIVSLDVMTRCNTVIDKCGLVREQLGVLGVAFKFTFSHILRTRLGLFLTLVASSTHWVADHLQIKSETLHNEAPFRDEVSCWRSNIPGTLFITRTD